MIRLWFVLAFSIAAALTTTGCAVKEEGPAERIGKGVDEIVGAMSDYNDDQEKKREAERRRQNSDPYYRDDASRDDAYYRDQNSDPSDYYRRSDRHY